MANTLIAPGDILEGQGVLLQHGRLIANVDYHLTIPSQTHFLVNPTGHFRLDYEDYAGGFILLTPEDAKNLSLTEYTLELANKHKRTIRVERRYKQIKRKGEARVTFWVKVVQ
jgi:hypothetical protein